MKPRWAAVILAGITLVGALLRAYQLGFRFLWHDEAVIYWISQGSMAQVFEQNALRNSAPPLFPILISLVTNWTHSEGGLRALPWIAGTLAIPAMYLLGRKFFSPTGSLVGALFLAVAPVQIEYSQEVREYSLTILLLILVLTAFVHFVELPTWKRALGLAAISSVGLITQYGFALMLVALNAVFLVHLVQVKEGRRNLLQKWGTVQTFLVIVSVAVVGIALRTQWQPGGFAGVKGYLSPGYWVPSGPISAVGFAYRNTRDLIDFAFPGLVFALTLYCGFLVALILQRNTLFPYLVGIPFCVFVASALLRVYPYLAARQDIILTPLIYLTAALGIDYLAKMDRKLIWVAVVLLQTFRLVSTPMIAYYRSGEKSDLGTVLRPLVDLGKPGEPVYVCDADDPVIAYYFRVRYPEFPMAERDLGTSPRHYLDQIDELLKGQPRVWLLMDRTCGDSKAFLDHISAEATVDIIEKRSQYSLYSVE